MEKHNLTLPCFIKWKVKDEKTHGLLWLAVYGCDSLDESLAALKITVVFRR